MNSFLRTIFLHLCHCIEQIDMHKKLSQVFSVGPKTPVAPGTSLSNGILPHFFFEIFINNNEYANEIIFILDHWMKGLIKLYH